MSDRLVVHAHVPGSGSSALNSDLFFRNFTRGETLLAYGKQHCHAARLSKTAVPDVEAMLDRARFALGHVPYGYFDGFGRWTIYISVFDDPVSRFLAFVRSVLDLPREAVRRLFGVECDAASSDPVGTMIAALLDKDDVRARHTNMMTRIAAGLPAFSGKAPLRAHLDVARANVLRSNYLVATRDQLPDFEVYLKEVLGVQTGPRGGDWDGAQPPKRKSNVGRIRREDVAAPLLRRIEAANDLDMRVYDAVQSQNASCWA